ncbi:hypothetical protein HDK64DRAFT_281021, partial [Phyllosticta capitalensis]
MKSKVRCITMTVLHMRDQAHPSRLFPSLLFRSCRETCKIRKRKSATRRQCKPTSAQSFHSSSRCYTPNKSTKQAGPSFFFTPHLPNATHLTTDNHCRAKSRHLADSTAEGPSATTHLALSPRYPAPPNPAYRPHARERAEAQASDGDAARSAPPAAAAAAVTQVPCVCVPGAGWLAVSSCSSSSHPTLARRWHARQRQGDRGKRDGGGGRDRGKGKQASACRRRGWVRGWDGMGWAWGWARSEEGFHVEQG